MRLLARIAVFWIIAGLVVGFILRQQLGKKRLNLVYSLSLLPWLGHLGYLVVYTLEHSQTLNTELMILAGVSALLVIPGFVIGLRFIRSRPQRLAFVPVILALLYGLPLIWFSAALRAQSISLGAISTAVLGGAALFVGSMLAVFTVGIQRSSSASLLRRKP